MLLDVATKMIFSTRSGRLSATTWATIEPIEWPAIVALAMPFSFMNETTSAAIKAGTKQDLGEAMQAEPTGIELAPWPR